ncbi:MAG: phenylpyruvate tautomerase MIF-related protein [Oscillospiraceae bacterium]|nr:phenylpyruvate tautomerase MIF-related protein [Oscillospiraceae bacterium]
MPVVKFTTNVKPDNSEKLLSDIAQCISEVLDKPLKAVMMMFSQQEFYMNSSSDPAAYIEIFYVGEIDASVKTTLTDSLLEIFIKELHVDPYRVYMNLIQNKREDAWRYIEK